MYEVERESYTCLEASPVSNSSLDRTGDSLVWFRISLRSGIAFVASKSPLTNVPACGAQKHKVHW